MQHKIVSGVPAGDTDVLRLFESAKALFPPDTTVDIQTLAQLNTSVLNEAVQSLQGWLDQLFSGIRLQVTSPPALSADQTAFSIGFSFAGNSLTVTATKQKGQWHFAFEPSFGTPQTLGKLTQALGLTLPERLLTALPRFSQLKWEAQEQGKWAIRVSIDHQWDLHLAEWLPTTLRDTAVLISRQVFTSDRDPHWQTQITTTAKIGGIDLPLQLAYDSTQGFTAGLVGTPRLPLTALRESLLQSVPLPDALWQVPLSLEELNLHMGNTDLQEATVRLKGPIQQEVLRLITFEEVDATFVWQKDQTPPLSWRVTLALLVKNIRLNATLISQDPLAIRAAFTEPVSLPRLVPSLPTLPFGLDLSQVSLPADASFQHYFNQEAVAYAGRTGLGTLQVVVVDPTGSQTIGIRLSELGLPSGIDFITDATLSYASDSIDIQGLDPFSQGLVARGQVHFNEIRNEVLRMLVSLLQLNRILPLSLSEKDGHMVISGQVHDQFQLPGIDVEFTNVTVALAPTVPQASFSATVVFDFGGSRQRLHGRVTLAKGATGVVVSGSFKPDTKPVIRLFPGLWLWDMEVLYQPPDGLGFATKFALKDPSLVVSDNERGEVKGTIGSTVMTSSLSATFPKKFELSLSGAFQILTGKVIQLGFFDPIRLTGYPDTSVPDGYQNLTFNFQPSANAYALAGRLTLFEVFVFTFKFDVSATKTSGKATMNPVSIGNGHILRIESTQSPRIGPTLEFNLEPTNLDNAYLRADGRLILFDVLDHKARLEVSKSGLFFDQEQRVDLELIDVTVRSIGTITQQGLGAESHFVVHIGLNDLPLGALENLKYLVPTAYISTSLKFKKEGDHISQTVSCFASILGVEIKFEFKLSAQTQFRDVAKAVLLEFPEALLQEESTLMAALTTGVLKSLGKAISRAGREVGKVIEQGADAVKGVIGGVIDSFTGNKAEFRKLNAEIEANKQDIRQNREMILKTREAVCEQQKMIAQNQREINALQSTVDRHEDMINQTQERMTELETKLLNTLLAQSQAEGEKFRQLQEQLNTETLTQVERLRRITEGVQSYTDQRIQTLNGQLQAIEQAMQRLEAALRRDIELMDAKFSFHIQILGEELDRASLGAKRDALLGTQNSIGVALREAMENRRVDRIRLAADIKTIAQIIVGIRTDGSLFNQFIETALPKFARGDFDITGFQKLYVDMAHGQLRILQIGLIILGHHLGVNSDTILRHLSRPNPDTASVHQKRQQHATLWKESLVHYQGVLEAIKAHQFVTTGKRPMVVNHLGSNGYELLIRSASGEIERHTEHKGDPS